MNIKQAKEEIKKTVTAYMTKDETGAYVLKTEKQRPIFMVGPPGVGKTAIIEQIANEMGVGVVSYSMTHHTRQSALGLPFITHKTYGDKEFDVSEYTMSEIVASVYDMIEETGIKEGILFLDEINCVSETLSPIMLQFLQYKTFGKHKIPDGYVVVTAGNPPEFNDSAREFDVVTLDRLKRIDVDADYGAWREYARGGRIHGAITSYLDIRASEFYKVSTTVDGKSFATARGWEDLSQMISLYEQYEFEVNESLVIQYIQDKKMARDFAIYYGLYKKYQSDYKVTDIIQGNPSDDILQRAKDAEFDERLAVVTLISSELTKQVNVIMDQSSEVHMELLSKCKGKFVATTKSARECLDDLLDAEMKGIEKLVQGKAIGAKEASNKKSVIERIRGIALPDHKDEAFAVLKADYDKHRKAKSEQAKSVSQQIGNGIAFCDKAFDGGKELFILMTELTSQECFMSFLALYGCDEYFKHNKELLLHDSRQKLLAQIDDVGQGNKTNMIKFEKGL